MVINLIILTTINQEEKKALAINLKALMVIIEKNLKIRLNLKNEDTIEEEKIELSKLEEINIQCYQVKKIICPTNLINLAKKLGTVDAAIVNAGEMFPMESVHTSR